MRIKKNIALSDTGFVFNPSTGDSFSVNPIGLDILKQLKDQKTEQEIVKYILATYQAEVDTIEKDYYDFTKMLEQMHLTDSDEQKEN